MNPLGQLTGDMSVGITLVFIFAAAWMVGLAIGRALRERRLERRQRPPSVPAPPTAPRFSQPPRPAMPGPLWQNHRLWEMDVERGQSLPPQPFTLPYDLPEVDSHPSHRAEFGYEDDEEEITRRFDGGQEYRLR